MRKTSFLPFLVLALSAPACGDDSADGGGGTGNGPSVGAGPSDGGGGGVAEDCSALPTLDLEGKWVVKLTLPASVSGGNGLDLSTCPANQDGDVTILLLMSIVSLSPNISAQFTSCSLTLPEFTGELGDTCTGTAANQIDFRYRRREGFEQDTDPKSITLPGEEPGTPFAFEPISFFYGSGAPLPEWDVDEVTCDDVALGHGGCEPDCVLGNCEEIDTWDNDEPGYTFGVCGAASGQNLENCELDDPTNTTDGISIQGHVYSTMFFTHTLSGEFGTSCDATGMVDTDFQMSYVGGDLYIDGQQISVTSEINGLPSFSLTTGTGTAHFVRIDGLHGSVDYDEGNNDDTCDVVRDHIDEF